METIKTIAQALGLAIVATIIVGTLSSMQVSQNGSVSFDGSATFGSHESQNVQTPNLDVGQSTSLSAGLPQE